MGKRIVSLPQVNHWWQAVLEENCTMVRKLGPGITSFCFRDRQRCAWERYPAAIGSTTKWKYRENKMISFTSNLGSPPPHYLLRTPYPQRLHVSDEYRKSQRFLSVICHCEPPLVRQSRAHWPPGDGTTTTDCSWIPLLTLHLPRIGHSHACGGPRRHPSYLS